MAEITMKEAYRRICALNKGTGLSWHKEYKVPSGLLRVRSDTKGALVVATGVGKCCGDHGPGTNCRQFVVGTRGGKEYVSVYEDALVHWEDGEFGQVTKDCPREA